MPPPRPGGARRTDRSGVGCSHKEGCPLFPLLNVSLRRWRDYYCDSEDRWRDCARYKLSLTGRLVPITLLPNGHDAQLLRPDPDADRSGEAEPRQAPPSRLNCGSPETAVPMARFEPAPVPVPVPPPSRPLEPSPPSQDPQPPAALLTRPAHRWWTRLARQSMTDVPQPPGSSPALLTPPARPARRSTHRWWTRLADWMTGPA
jgi:hypothetical protein